MFFEDDCAKVVTLSGALNDEARVTLKDPAAAMVVTKRNVVPKTD